MMIDKIVPDRRIEAPNTAHERQRLPRPVQVCGHFWPDPVRGIRQQCGSCGTTRYIPKWLLIDEECYAILSTNGTALARQA